MTQLRRSSSLFCKWFWIDGNCLVWQGPLLNHLYVNECRRKHLHLYWISILWKLNASSWSPEPFLSCLCYDSCCLWVRQKQPWEQITPALLSTHICPVHSHLHRAAFICVMNNIKVIRHPFLTHLRRQHMNWLVLAKLEVQLSELWLQFTSFCSY